MLISKSLLQSLVCLNMQNFHNQKFPTLVSHVITHGAVTKESDRGCNVPSVLYDYKCGVVICPSSDIYAYTIYIMLTQFQHQVINK